MKNVTDDQAAVLRLLTSAQAVLFDFDGPICDLFGGVSTAGVAEQVKRKARRCWGPLDQDVEECDDSHGILRRLRDMYDRSHPKPGRRRPLDLAERIVTRQERKAVRTAVPTADIVTVVDLLHRLRKRLVIVSNNAERPITVYLQRSELSGKFERVFGRDPKNATLMKPDPDCVRRALRYISPNQVPGILIGDQLTDLEAAKSTGTPFLGYTKDASKADEMMRSGAAAVVSSYTPVITAARELLRLQGEPGMALPSAMH